MHDHTLKFNIIIATKNRLHDLLECLQSIARQFVLPEEIIIVDASEAPLMQEVLQQAASPVSIKYIKSPIAGLPSQRNIGVSHLALDTEVVVFLDDDVILKESCFKEMLQAFADHPEVAGLTGIAINLRRADSHPLSRLFLLSGPQPGVVLPSGVNTLVYPDVHSNMLVEWLPGWCCCYRYEIIENFRFDSRYEHFGGYAYCEDLDFSYGVSASGYALMVAPQLRLVHKESPTERLNDYTFGIAQVANRGMFVEKHWGTWYHRFCFLWSTLGLIGSNSLMALMGKRSWQSFLGNLYGLAWWVAHRSGEPNSTPKIQRSHFV